MLDPKGGGAGAPVEVTLIQIAFSFSVDMKRPVCLEGWHNWAAERQPGFSFPLLINAVIKALGKFSRTMDDDLV